MHPFRLALALAACGTLAFTVGCGSKRPAAGAETGTSSDEGKIDGVKSPEWIGNPTFGGVIGAVGTARPSLGGFGEQMKQAQQGGRTEIARTISTRIQAAYVRYFQEGGEIYQGAKGPEYQKMATEMSEDTSRQLTNQVIEGSTQKAYWQHPESKELFVWMVVSPEIMAKVGEQVKADARRQLDRRSAVAAELKTKDALSRLDAAIDAELNRTGQM